MKYLIPIFLFVMSSSLDTSISTLPTNENTDKAVLIGVAHYEHLESWKYADDDAYRFYALEKLYSVEDENISILIDEDATNEGMLKAIQQQALSCEKENNLFIYFSGHTDSIGIVGIDGIYGNLLKYESIATVLKKSKAQHKFLVINGAYSKISEVVFDKKTTVWFTRSEGEKNQEDENLRQSIFGHFLIRGLKGGADVNNDGVVELQELADYVYEKVKNYTDDKQHPKMINFAPKQWVAK
jgi:hypothetical protein